MSGGFKLDMAEFDARLKRADGIVKSAVLKGLRVAAAALKKDGDEIEPKSPHLWGNLRGNATRNPAARGTALVNKDYWPRTQLDSKGPLAYSIIVAYCAPYAARWHEAVGERINWSEVGVGPKWLEAKISRDDLRGKYYSLLADTIKEELTKEGKAK